MLSPTFMGASSSNRMGCEMKISRALVQRYRISASNSWTCFPGRLPLTSSSLSMMESKSTSFSAMVGSWELGFKRVEKETRETLRRS